MSFNVWLGGDVVDLGKVAEVIRAADAGIVGLQEAEGNTRRIAEALGWPYWSDRHHVVSRYPLIDPPAARGEYVLAQVRPGEVFALANAHLTSDPYGPYEVRDGRSLRRVLRLERGLRLPEMRVTLDALRAGLPRDMPALLTGDFNTPSHLDWTADAVGIRPQVRYPVPWPVTKAIERAGFVDTYRAVHPDPVATPGITWTFGYPFPRLDSRRGDRPDRHGPRAAPGAGARRRDRRAAGHAGRRPGRRSLSVRPPGGVRPRAPGAGRAARLRLRAAPPGGPRRADRRALRAAARRAPRPDRRGARRRRPARAPDVAASAGGRVLRERDVRLGRARAGPLRRPAGRARRARGVAEHVLGRRARRAAARAGGAGGPAGRPIRVAWSSAPALRRDWIGIYRAGDPDLYNAYLAFAYTGATVAGRTSFAGDARTYPPGRYVARLMRDDGYGVLAEAPFRVVAG